MENPIIVIVAVLIGFGIQFLVIRAAVGNAIRSTADVFRAEVKPTE